MVNHKDEKVEINRSDGTKEIWSLDKLIPKLPSSFMSLVWATLPSPPEIEKKKKALEKYCQALLDLITCGVRASQEAIVEDEEGGPPVAMNDYTPNKEPRKNLEAPKNECSF